MDFSWVKQLAEHSNQQEINRQEKDRREKEDKKTVALATCPFVEKLHVVISTASEEFNKHCMFNHMRVSAGKLYKHSKTGEEATAEPDEVAYFTFYRMSSMYGIRGINGCIEFVQVPVGDNMGITIRLHEMAVPTSKRLDAEIEPDTKKIRWVCNGQTLDGPAIISLCQKFFVELIEQTNAEIK